jgi:hypothetical protein
VVNAFSPKTDRINLARENELVEDLDALGVDAEGLFCGPAGSFDVLVKHALVVIASGVPYESLRSAAPPAP